MRSSKAAAWSIVCGLALRASAAAAETPVAPAPAQEAVSPIASAPAPSPAAVPAMRWYGWQTLVGDAGAVGLFGLAVLTDDGSGQSTSSQRAATIGLGAYFLLGPVVHAAHGHWAKAGLSLALRVGLPALGAAAGFGLGIGAVAAVALDAALLAREPYTAPVRRWPL